MGGIPAWIGFTLFVIALLAFDLGVLHRKDKEVSIREALWLSLGYFLLALLFGAGVFHFSGSKAGYEFMTGYLVEKSLSIDNIFVFVLVFTQFSVPARYQHKVLLWGVLGALVMRAILILLGAAAIAAFHWIIYVFGGFLVVTGIKMLAAVDREPDLSRSPVLRFVRRRFRMTDGFMGGSFLVRCKGTLYITPLLVVLILIEFTDAVFALDSIPAIFGITADPFIVYTSNVFAILGLRALYFALAGIIHRFHYLKYGLSLLLILIGLKMIVNAAFGKIISTEAALLATLGLIGGSVLLSLARPRRAPEAPAVETTRGWVPLCPPKQPREPGPDEPQAG